MNFDSGALGAPKTAFEFRRFEENALHGSHGSAEPSMVSVCFAQQRAHGIDARARDHRPCSPGTRLLTTDVTPATRAALSPASWTCSLSGT